MREKEGLGEVIAFDAGAEKGAHTHDATATLLEQYFAHGGMISHSREAISAAHKAVRAKVAAEDYFTPVVFAYKERRKMEQEGSASVYEALVEMYAAYQYEKHDAMLDHDEKEARALEQEILELTPLLATIESNSGFLKFAEAKARETYEEYLRHLGMTDGDVRDKDQVLDIGAGARFFASHAIRQGINRNVYSIDMYKEHWEEDRYMRVLWPSGNTGELGSKTVYGNREALPFKDAAFNLVLIHGAMPYGFKGDGKRFQAQQQEAVQITFAEITRVLATAGEVRLWPLHYAKGRHAFHRPVLKMIDQELTKLRSSGEYTVVVEDVQEKGRHSQRVVIRKKEKKG